MPLLLFIPKMSGMKRSRVGDSSRKCFRNKATLSSSVGTFRKITPISHISNTLRTFLKILKHANGQRSSPTFPNYLRQGPLTRLSATIRKWWIATRASTASSNTSDSRLLNISSTTQKPLLRSKKSTEPVKISLFGSLDSNIKYSRACSIKKIRFSKKVKKSLNKNRMLI